MPPRKPLQKKTNFNPILKGKVKGRGEAISSNPRKRQLTAKKPHKIKTIKTIKKKKKAMKEKEEKRIQKLITVKEKKSALLDLLADSISRKRKGQRRKRIPKPHK